jgi:hypothetical protein
MISTKSMPGMGKSGNERKVRRSSTFAPASWAEEEEVAAGCRPEASWAVARVEASDVLLMLAAVETEADWGLSEALIVRRKGERGGGGKERREEKKREKERDSTGGGGEDGGREAETRRGRARQASRSQRSAFR